MSKTDAEYMRAYRARRKAVTIGTASTMEELADLTNPIMAKQAGRIAELEAEVKHLKAELAKRTSGPAVNPEYAERWAANDWVGPKSGSFNSRPFTPSPKVKTHR